MQRRALLECEADPSWLTQEYHRSATLVGPLDQIATGLCERLPRRTTPSIVGRPARTSPEPPPGAPDGSYADFGAFLARLGEQMRPDTTVVLDTGAHTVWAAQHLRLTQRQQVLVSSRLGTMGFSLPAAVAAQLADPNGRVVAVCGDGGFQMVAGELATMVQYGLAHRGGRRRQRRVRERPRPAGGPLRHDSAQPRLRRAGQSLQRRRCCRRRTSDVDGVLRAAFAQLKRPTLLAVRCDPAVMAPLSRWEPAARLGD